ncbi:hypothetical protein B0H14DRAFT_3088623 [Mycena olivaceomarginata]|nr:hypothetical protein B0H14DRAFT_3088623 [Mycena olivaceomarginata]
MLALALLALPLLSTAAVHGRRDDHSHSAANSLPSTWFHDPDHPGTAHFHELFRRTDATDGVTYPTVGSKEWAAGFPAPFPSNGIDTSNLPAAWVAALNDAVARKAIPDVGIPKLGADGNPAYPNGGDGSSPEICSGTYGCRIDGDIWDGPDGYVGISFDDGPADGTADLLSFLKTKNQRVTHFLIGSQIIYLPDLFTQMFNMGDDLAVHTWSHPYMTTQTNLQVVAELGWTMQLIQNSTDGRIPKFWRVYTDKRLQTIVWNHDTDDWTLTETPPYTTPAKIQSDMKQWLTGSKSPGLIILEHELSKDSTAAFIAAYPLMQENNWKLVSLATLMGKNVTYQNAADNVSPVTKVNLVDAKNGAAAVAPAASAAASAKSSSASAASATAQKANSASGAVGASSAPTSTASGTSSAVSQWTTGPTALLTAVVVLMLWK